MSSPPSSTSSSPSGAGDAIKKVYRLLCRGYTDIVDADLSKYFDTIPHAELLRCVARRIVDGDSGRTKTNPI